jgi:excisionase family DNA binding protein
VNVELPDDALETIAARAAELVVERLEAQSALPELMTPDEAAAYLRCSRQRIYNLRSAGKLSRLADGGRALIRRSELDAYIGLVDELSGARARRRVA